MMNVFFQNYKKNTVEKKQIITRNLPDDILIYLFKLFQLRELSFIPRLSKKWKNIFWNSTFWNNKEKYKNLSNFLSIALFDAVKNKRQIELIERYCKLGANLNCYFQTLTDKDYGWFSSKVAFFTKSTSLSIAANYASNQYGENVVKLLLKYGANPMIKSVYSLRWLQPTGYLTDEVFFEERPDKSARKRNIKYLLLMAVHQFLVESKASQEEVVSSLDDVIKMKLSN